MSDVAEEWGFLKTAWQVAYALTGCREGASKVFRETVEEIQRHPASMDADGLLVLFYTALRKRALRYPARNDLSGKAADVHRLAEPGRSAWLFLLLGALSSDEIEPVLEMTERQLADAVEKARAQLRAAEVAS